MFKAFVGFGLGFIAACTFILGSEPDQPAKSQVCIPLYDQTGLECCQLNSGDPND